jgi:hypothetical protein
LIAYYSKEIGHEDIDHGPWPKPDVFLNESGKRAAAYIKKKMSLKWARRYNKQQNSTKKRKKQL